MRVLLFHLVLSLYSAIVAENTCQKCNLIDNEKINIHIIPHSHIDVGWLKTVNEYYEGSGLFYGRRDAGVQFIINSVIDSLQKNSTRRFTLAETAYFWKWWQLQNAKRRKQVFDLVNNGQLEIVNGALTISDEATTNYQSIIDQYTWGFRFLNDTFGKCGRPRIAWQLGPFGHSRGYSSIIKEMGFEALILGRVDYQDVKNRKTKKELNFFWNCSSNSDDPIIFTAILPDDKFKFPQNLCFDITCKDRNVITVNSEAQVEKFLSILEEYKEYYNEKNIMILMGQEFGYQIAEINFYNLDGLIKRFNNHSMYNVFYSTPSCYIKALQTEYKTKPPTLSVKQEDFLPYATDSTTFWTGFFTSRPNLKRLERTANNILQAVKQLAAFAKIESQEHNVERLVNPLREAVAMMQGHNVLTGTSVQHVVNNYIQILLTGIEKAQQAAEKIISYLTQKYFRTSISQQVISTFFKNLPNNNFFGEDLNLQTCLLANLSICETTKWNKFIIIIYNPLAKEVSHYVRFPVNSNESFNIFGPYGEEDYDIFHSLSHFKYGEKSKPGVNECVFLARNLPPMGISFYHVEKIANRSDQRQGRKILKANKYFGTPLSGFSIDGTTGRLSSVKINGINLGITQEFLYYPSFPGKSTSGSYVFHPNETSPILMNTDPIDVRYQTGKLIDQVHQIFSTNELTQIIRIYKHEEYPYIEFDWLIGNLDTRVSGKEVVTVYHVKDFSNEGTFITDTNGWGHITRKLNVREDYHYEEGAAPRSSNYYPVTSDIRINDRKRRMTVAVVTDRPQGGTTDSRKDGSIELMIHRRLISDDKLGLDEILNEREYKRGVYVRGQHFFTFGYSDLYFRYARNIEMVIRDIKQRKQLSPWILYGEIKENFRFAENIRALTNFQHRSLTNALPENVHILTLEPWKDDTFLLRLEHIYEKDDENFVFQDAMVDIKDIFLQYKIIEIKETTLGANMWLQEYEEMETIWKDKVHSDTFRQSTYKIILKPMQIRTFIVKIVPK